jgi:O-succinylbenzoate synthase
LNIESVDIYRYRVPFREPISVRGVRVGYREGLVLALRAQGCTSAAYGEVAPLPGLHDESVGMAAEELAASIPWMVKACSKGGESLDGFLSQHGRFPSVQTGLEMALLNLDAVTSATLPSFPGSFPARNPVPLNALLFGKTESVLELAGTCYMEGYRTFKLKVQATEADLAIASIRALTRSSADGSSSGLTQTRP